MAPTHKAGKTYRLWCGTIRLSRIMDDGNVSRAVDTVEQTVYEDEWKRHLPGQRMGDFSCSGLFDGSTEQVHAILETALQSTANPTWTSTPIGSAVGNPALLFESIATAFDVSAPAAGRVSVSGGATPNGRLASGFSLVDGTSAKTSTGAQAAVDSAVVAGTTGGGVAHFHLTDAASLTSVTVVVQHSSAAVSWADLATFTTTVVAQQRTAVAGTIKRHIRGTITAFTGAGGKTVNVETAFARLNP